MILSGPVGYLEYTLEINGRKTIVEFFGDIHVPVDADTACTDTDTVDIADLLLARLRSSTCPYQLFLENVYDHAYHAKLRRKTASVHKRADRSPLQQVNTLLFTGSQAALHIADGSRLHYTDIRQSDPLLQLFTDPEESPLLQHVFNGRVKSFSDAVDVFFDLYIETDDYDKRYARSFTSRFRSGLLRRWRTGSNRNVLPSWRGKRVGPAFKEIVRITDPVTQLLVQEFVVDRKNALKSRPSFNDPGVTEALSGLGVTPATLRVSHLGPVEFAKVVCLEIHPILIDIYTIARMMRHGRESSAVTPPQLGLFFGWGHVHTHTAFVDFVQSRASELPVDATVVQLVTPDDRYTKCIRIQPTSGCETTEREEDQEEEEEDEEGEDEEGERRVVQAYTQLLSYRDLYTVARRRDIPGRSTMTKHTLYTTMFGSAVEALWNNSLHCSDRATVYNRGLSRSELYALARQRSIRGRSGMSKRALCGALFGPRL